VSELQSGPEALVAQARSGDASLSAFLIAAEAVRRQTEKKK